MYQFLGRWAVVGPLLLTLVSPAYGIEWHGSIGGFTIVSKPRDGMLYATITFTGVTALDRGEAGAEPMPGLLAAMNFFTYDLTLGGRVPFTGFHTAMTKTAPAGFEPRLINTGFTADLKMGPQAQFDLDLDTWQLIGSASNMLQFDGKALRLGGPDVTTFTHASFQATLTADQSQDSLVNVLSQGGSISGVGTFRLDSSSFPSTSSAVPEPGSLGLLGMVGLSALAYRLRRCRGSNGRRSGSRRQLDRAGGESC